VGTYGTVNGMLTRPPGGMQSPTHDSSKIRLDDNHAVARTLAG
jgi:hypothetical protein